MTVLDVPRRAALEIAMKVPARAQKHGRLDSKLKAVKAIPAHLMRAQR